MTTTNHPFAGKLTLNDAERIRARYAAGEPPGALAEEFGVSASSLFDVLRGRTHRRRVTVDLAAGDLERLDQEARASGTTREEAAAHLLRAALHP